MEGEVICLDTSILIEYYRKKDKQKSVFYLLTNQYALFSVSIITVYEIYIGSNPEQVKFWEGFFSRVSILSFDTSANDRAVLITKQLKVVNKLIEIPDILIAATALANQMPLATLNHKHFARIQQLQLVEISNPQ